MISLTVFFILAIICFSTVTARDDQRGLDSVGSEVVTEFQENVKVIPVELTNSTDVDCDIRTEETCYSDDGIEEYCAKLSEGGCPCDEGEVKCGYSKHSAGYCTTVCCDPQIEETCYNRRLKPIGCSLYENGGCPCKNKDQVKCGYSTTDPGYCTDTCCDEQIEETCLGDDGRTFCAKFSEGGCACENDDEVKCGYSAHFPGYCTKVCCDSSTEETCYDSNWNPLWCASIVGGGCPCPQGQVKCGRGPTTKNAGYCTDLCCDFRTDEVCEDENGNRYCANIANGGCPCPCGQEKCGANENYAGYCVAEGTCPINDDENIESQLAQDETTSSL